MAVTGLSISRIDRDRLIGGMDGRGPAEQRGG
jgi:hypothetical protein